MAGASCHFFDCKGLLWNKNYGIVNIEYFDRRQSNVEFPTLI